MKEIKAYVRLSITPVERAIKNRTGAEGPGALTAWPGTIRAGRTP